MKLKRYIHFLKESLKEDIEEKSLWKLTEQDIEEYMLEITDAGYYIEVQFGFSEKVKQGSYKNGNWTEIEKDVFTEKVKSGDGVIPAYWISIHKGTRIKNYDVTSTFQFACSIISEEANAEISIHDCDPADGPNLGNPDGIVIKGGLFFLNDSKLLEAEDYIAIFAKSKESVSLTDEDVAKYYNWADDFFISQ